MTAAIIIIPYRVVVIMNGTWTYIFTEIHHFTDLSVLSEQEKSCCSIRILSVSSILSIIMTLKDFIKTALLDLVFANA